MSAKYLVRLDDACPTFTLSKWKRFFDLFERYNIKPIIAVIPANRDPKLRKEYRSEAEFWKMVKIWQNLGWCIALHGFDHVYINNESGINKITPHSEFVGLPLDEQKKRIKQGIGVFLANGIDRPDVFVAPSHSLDNNTLEALKDNGVSIVSDGLYKHPYIYRGLKWVPCQLWWPQNKRNGVWTICYHPETATDSAVKQLEEFIKVHDSDFISIEDTETSSVTINDRLFRKRFFINKSMLLNSFLGILRRYLGN